MGLSHICLKLCGSEIIVFANVFDTTLNKLYQYRVKRQFRKAIS